MGGEETLFTQGLTVIGGDHNDGIRKPVLLLETGDQSPQKVIRFRNRRIVDSQIALSFFWQDPKALEGKHSLGRRQPLGAPLEGPGREKIPFLQERRPRLWKVVGKADLEPDE